MSAYENAAFSTVHDYSQGAKALAELIGVPYSVLLHKVNPNDAANDLTVKQAIRIMLASGDDRMLHGIGADIGASVVVMRVDDVGDPQTLQALSEAMGRFGTYVETFSAAIADGKVTARELREIDNTLAKVIQKAAYLRAVASAMSKKGRHV